MSPTVNSTPETLLNGVFTTGGLTKIGKQKYAGAKYTRELRLPAFFTSGSHVKYF
jgi:hypothetical protein